jgi:hypothetical protein
VLQLQYMFMYGNISLISFWVEKGVK